VRLTSVRGGPHATCDRSGSRRPHDEVRLKPRGDDVRLKPDTTSTVRLKADPTYAVSR
jgi:hypothetical protein